MPSAASAAERRIGRRLLGKVLLLAGGAWFLLSFVFGILRCPDEGMKPAVCAGDAVLFSRLRFPRPGETAVVKTGGRTVLARVIAASGDTVDITEQGLLINGARQQEPGIHEETFQMESAVRFPLQVSAGRLFLLGDHRSKAVDSRLYGSVDRTQIQGTVIAVLRTRGI
jgi:signal peptidase I